MRCFLWACKVKKDPFQLLWHWMCTCHWESAVRGSPCSPEVDRGPLPNLALAFCHGSALIASGSFSLSLPLAVPMWGFGSGWLWALPGSCDLGTTLALWEVNEHLRRRTWLFRKKNPYWGKRIEEQLLCKEESGPWSPPFLSPALIWRYFTVGFWRVTGSYQAALNAWSRNLWGLANQHREEKLAMSCLRTPKACSKINT